MTPSYRPVSARDAIRSLPKRCRVLLPPGCGMPLTLAQALADDRDHFESLEIIVGLMLQDYPFLKHIGGNIKLKTWHVSGPSQKLVDEGKAEYFPLRLSQTGSVFLPGGPLAVDAVLTPVSQPDHHGYCSLGAAVGPVINTVRAAPRVIAEINLQMPRTLGDCFINIKDASAVVEADYPVVEYPRAKVGDLERKIAGYVSELLPDGAVLQMGIGSVPEAVIDVLDGKQDLGVHSGMVSDGFIRLFEQGIVNNSRKAVDRHKTVVGELMGTKELFSYAHNNPFIHLAPVTYSHNMDVIRRLDNFVSINSAIEVDLTGQVNSETIGARQIAGVGGQFDFVEGALYSKGGKTICAMTATAGGGKFSRIVARLAAGAMVSTPRYCLDYVVTEYGIADLRYKTLRERAEALIAVAHPSFRDELARSMERGEKPKLVG